MKKQEILDILWDHPEAVFVRSNNRYHNFTIIKVGSGGQVLAKNFRTILDDDVEGWKIDSGTFNLSTREVGDVIANSPEEALEAIKKEEEEREKRSAQAREDQLRRRELGVRLMQALQGFGIDHRFYQDREDCMDWETIGWWSLVQAKFDLDLTDEIERLISLIEHAKVEA